MKKELIAPVYTGQNAVLTVQKSKWKYRLSLLFYPVGVVNMWRGRARLWVKLLYTVFILPIFLLVAAWLGIILFSAFLPRLDRSVGNRADKTIYNGEGNYSATFKQSSRETNNAYELVEVELEPNGGNDWHYHSNFTEQFTVIEGRVRIGNNGKEMILDKGQTATADKKDMHYFMNALNQKSVLLVKVTPAAGLEKTLRVAYGLINDGLLKNDMTQNPWHMCLLLAYSESYLPGMPAWFQEPLINALAKIAQWKGEDRELYKYFM